ncbi:MAG: zf-HC2 domain-containing protein [Acidobacteria bacterium]|nr:zf-HC2 domain-containing protein [Acidobacteriota bacterium]
MTEQRFRCPLQSEENAQLLLDYCARRLDPSRRAALEAHIGLCPSCREFSQAQRLVWEALDAWDSSGGAADFDRRLYQRISEERKPPWADRLTAWTAEISWKPALPAAAALALWVTFFPVRPTEEAEGFERVAAEQVEGALEDLDMLQQLKLNLQ